LAEIAPGFRHPLNGKTMAELWTAFDQSASPMTVEPIKL
jgi:2-amino-4-hydroxy-6-hydroxymethyldihydropteridine diphosphokinase